MSSQNTQFPSGLTCGCFSIGGGFPGLLALVFITLKLAGTIEWPWYAVLAPLWIPPALSLAVLAVVVVAALIAFACLLLCGVAVGVYEKMTT